MIDPAAFELAYEEFCEVPPDYKPNTEIQLANGILAYCRAILDDVMPIIEKWEQRYQELHARLESKGKALLPYQEDQRRVAEAIRKLEGR